MHKASFSKIDEIATVLQNTTYSQAFGLYSGNAGIVLFLYYYARFKDAPAINHKASKMLAHVFKQVEEMSQPLFSFCSGVAGVGWMVDHLCHHGFINADSKEILSNIDEYLYKYTLLQLNRGDYDFLHGAMGIVFYFIKRKRMDYLQKLIQALALTAIWDGEEAKWSSFINREEGITGYSIALSHGSSSIALVLCKVLQMLPQEEMVKTLLEGAVTYIVHQEVPVERYGSYYPSFSIESQPELYKSRLGWCYGDLGVALAIWQAGITLQHQAWIDKGMEVLLFSAKKRGLRENSVFDAGICHGTAGIAQIFHRLYLTTKQEEFRDAAEYWFTETLNMAKFKDGLAGYKVWRSEKHGGLETKSTFLEGIAGIGLSLLSFVMQEDPAWDECLLLS